MVCSQTLPYAGLLGVASMSSALKPLTQSIRDIATWGVVVGLIILPVMVRNTLQQNIYTASVTLYCL